VNAHGPTIETTCGDTWPTLRHELDRLKVGAFAGPAGTFRQRTEITPQRAILAQLELADPPRIYQLTPAAQPPDQREHPRLDTLRLRRRWHIPAGHPKIRGH
jgi:hypothetical protein